ncbi:MAG: iron-containing alcohol dehydrogenase [Proteobacteria bacterium]|nr:iron-containing alcohol dehydrogenase [Pseudomonadota bacterium]
MNTSPAFVFARMPELHFGAGQLAQLPSLLAHSAQQRQRILLITGSASFVGSAHYEKLTLALTAAGIDYFQQAVAGEPSPELVDQTAERYRAEAIDWVVAIGGGSAMDAGKAISAMLPQQGSVTAYLEGMETAKHDGRKTPFVAVPTSSGTGSEATKNAVLSRIGASGFKASLRHDNFIPDVALIDPELMLSCPQGVTAACGLDALTQLIEAYVSSKASPLTDALALSGLQHFSAGFDRALADGDRDIDARGELAYAAFLSGVTLANAGLGVVHGFAGPLGAYFPIPHGVACGTLLGEATRATIDALFAAPEQNRLALEKYARVGALLAGQTSGALRDDCAQLVATLAALIERVAMPRLSRYGITRDDLPKILDKANNKNSPVMLSREQMAAILEARL